MQVLRLFVFLVVTCGLAPVARAQVDAEAPAPELAANQDPVELPRIAVLGLRADTELDEGTVRTLNEIVLSAFAETGKFDVLGSSDIASIINLEAQRQALTCADDTCLAELGGALGVDLMALASVGSVGNQYVISVKVLDVSRVIALGRGSTTVKKNDDELIRAIRSAVVSAAARGTTTTLRVDQSAVERPMWKTVAPWVGVGLTVVAGGIGVGLGAAASGDASAAREEFEGSAAWQDYTDSAERRALTADIMYGVAGAFAVSTVLFWLFGYEKGPTASVQPEAGGASATLSIAL